MARSLFSAAMQAASSGASKRHIALPPGREFYQVTEGSPVIDILGFKVVKPLFESPFAAGAFAPFATYAAHGQIIPDGGQIVCPRLTLGQDHECAVCSAMAALKLDPAKEAISDKIRPKNRQLFWVVPAVDTSTEPVPKLLDQSVPVFGRALATAHDLAEHVGDFWHPSPAKGGMSVKVAFVKKPMGNGQSFIGADQALFMPRQRKFQPSIMAHLIDPGTLLQFMSMDQMTRVLRGAQLITSTSVSVPAGMPAGGADDEFTQFVDSALANAGDDDGDFDMGDTVPPVQPSASPAPVRPADAPPAEPPTPAVSSGADATAAVTGAAPAARRRRSAAPATDLPAAAAPAAAAPAAAAPAAAAPAAAAPAAGDDDLFAID